MFRLPLIGLCALALAACAPDVPDSARGVGFESYSDYMRRRDAELAGQRTGRVQQPGMVISTERATAGGLAPAPVTSGPIGAGPIGAGPMATVAGNAAADRPRADTVAGVAPQAGEVRHTAGGARISDEQSFDAVSARETIESDRERLQRQREQYVVVQPTAVPERTGPATPNIVEFALSTRHNPGQQVYRRSAIRFTSYERACGAFTSADLAQEAFLARGGPERDPLGVDPDGDGFACGWDPRPFRAALR